MRRGTPPDLSDSYHTTPELAPQSPFQPSARPKGPTEHRPRGTRLPEARTIGSQDAPSRNCGPTYLTNPCWLPLPGRHHLQPAACALSPQGPAKTCPVAYSLTLYPNMRPGANRSMWRNLLTSLAGRPAPNPAPTGPSLLFPLGPGPSSRLRSRPSAAQRPLNDSDHTRMRRLPPTQWLHEDGLHPEPVRPQHVREHLIPDGAGRSCISSHHRHRPPKRDGKGLPRARDHRETELLSDLSHSPPARRVAHETRPHPPLVSGTGPPPHVRADIQAVPIDQRIVQV